MSSTVGLLARHTPNGPLGRSAALIDIAQDLLLGRLVDDGIFEHLVFKGGTDLRKAYAGNADRFSTDLDFSSLKAGEDPAVIQDLLADTINGARVDGFDYTVELRRERRRFCTRRRSDRPVRRRRSSTSGRRCGSTMSRDPG